MLEPTNKDLKAKKWSVCVYQKRWCEFFLTLIAGIEKARNEGLYDHAERLNITLGNTVLHAETKSKHCLYLQSNVDIKKTVDMIYIQNA